MIIMREFPYYIVLLNFVQPKKAINVPMQTTRQQNNI
jgi:hypothetical protein